MAAEKLTAQGIKALKAPGRYGDGKGLYYIIDPSGRTSRWVLRFSFGGRVTEMGIGGYPDVTLAAAREKASTLRLQVKAGVNPIAEKREKRAAVQAERERSSKPTFGEVADAYVQRNQKQWKNDKHRAQWIMTLTKLAAPIRGLPVDEVETEKLIELLEPIWARTPETASRLRGRIEMVLNDARIRGHIPMDRANPARWNGHLQVIFGKRKKAEQKHHASLPYADTPAFVARLKQADGVSARALLFLIFTAARTGEVLGARWDEIDFKQKVWTVPGERMKAGTIHRVPLTEPAVAILKEMHKIAVDDLVFPSMRSGKPMSDMAMTTVLRRLDLGDVATVHGFRATFRSWVWETQGGDQREVAEAALAHVLGDKVEAAYRRGDALAKRRALMETWADFLVGEAE